jgi:hypothetical protein
VKVISLKLGQNYEKGLLECEIILYLIHNFSTTN